MENVSAHARRIFDPLYEILIKCNTRIKCRGCCSKSRVLISLQRIYATDLIRPDSGDEAADDAVQGRRDPRSNLIRRSRRGLKWGWDAGLGPEGELEGTSGKGRGREGGKKGGGAAQPSSYWLGGPFFGRRPGRAGGV